MDSDSFDGDKQVIREGVVGAMSYLKSLHYNQFLKKFVGETS